MHIQTTGEKIFKTPSLYRKKKSVFRPKDIVPEIFFPLFEH